MGSVYIKNLFKWGVSAIIFIFSFFIIIFIIKHYKSLRYINEHEILHYIKNGDILCRLGEKIWSPIIKELSPNDKRYSHLGIIRIENNNIYVIHSEALANDKLNFVKKTLLSDFLSKAQSVGIYRLINIEGEKISDMSINYIGYPFDWQFDMDDDSKLYCTELLYVLLKDLSPEVILNIVWLDKINKYVIPLDVVTQKEYFLEIKYLQK